MNIEHDVTR